MPISSKTFDSSPDSVNPKLMDLFIKHPNNAYSTIELQKTFGDSIIVDLILLAAVHKKLESKSKGGETYYRLKK
jgi:hypothetical protein